MNKSISERNTSIDYLKSLCGIFVILGHSIGHISSDYGCAIPQWIKIITSPIYVHVPLFFVIGGFLSHPQKLKTYYLKKVKRVLIPYYFFSGLKLLYTNVISDQFSHSSAILGQLYDALILGRLYWFSYTIFVIYCISTILWKKKNNIPIVCWIVFVFTFVVSIFNSVFGFLDKLPIIFQLTSVVKYLPFFTVGMLIKNYEEKIKLLNTNKLFVSIITFFTYILLYWLSEKCSVFTNYFFWFTKHLLIMIILFNVVNGLRENTIVKKLSDYSYQLMLIDSFFRVVILVLFDKLFTVGIYTFIPQTILSVICGVIVCEIVSKTKILKFLFGL